MNANLTMDNLLGAIFEQIDTIRDAEEPEEVDAAIKKGEAISDLSDKAIRVYGLAISTVKLQDKRAGYRQQLAPLPHMLSTGGEQDAQRP